MKRLSNTWIVIVFTLFYVTGLYTVYAMDFEKPNILVLIGRLIMWIIDHAEITIPIIALFFAYWQWRRKVFFDMKALFNSLLEEFHHNLNLRDGGFSRKLTADEIKEVYKLMDDKLSQGDIHYPNPTDIKNPSLHPFMEMAVTNKIFNAGYKSPGYMKLQSNAIETSLVSGLAVNYLPKRLYLNLGHIFFSIIRHNALIDDLDSISEYYYSSMQSQNKRWEDQHVHMVMDFMLWTYYRNYCILLDLVDTVPKWLFVDEKFVQEMLDKGGRTGPDKKVERLYKWAVRTGVSWKEK